MESESPQRHETDKLLGNVVSKTSTNEKLFHDWAVGRRLGKNVKLIEIYVSNCDGTSW